jgi:hypothetical protein
MQNGSLVGIALCALAATAHGATVSNANFVNGLALDGAATDLSAGSAFDRRVGYFSDLYFDANRNQWWGLSDRGPGGGTLPYATRVQRFTLNVGANGTISNFAIAETVLFKDQGVAMNGLAPAPTNQLGRSFDPEGFVVLPKSGRFLVSDEYGPAVREFDRNGNLIRTFTMPGNLIPKTGAGVDFNAAPPVLTSGREGNRGFEGLAVSPDGKYAYAVLQNGTVQDGWTAAARGQYTRIVKFDVETGTAVAQYAYALDSTSQGRGVSAIVALGNDKFLVIERNNRGVGVGANLANPDKNVYEVDLSGASDVSGISLPTVGDLPAGFVAAAKGAKVIDLDANTLAAIGNRSPEKWEGLAIGHQLGEGSYLLLAGSDNDYSVTQNGTGTQFDVYFRFSDADPYASSIQCPINGVTDCFFTAGGGAAALSDQYSLLPGVLHAYTANISDYVAPIPEPQTAALALFGLGLVGAFSQRSRATRRRDGR